MKAAKVPPNPVRIKRAYELPVPEASKASGGVRKVQ